VSPPRYHSIAESLRTEIARGCPPPGGRLPSEAALTATYGVARATLRRALEELRQEGLIEARAGAGWYVRGDPVRQRLGRLTTIESQLAEEGRQAARRVVRFGFEPATGRVAEVLGVGEVLRVERVSTADGEPFARVTVWVGEAVGAHLSRSDVERRSFYELLPVSLGGATQTIGAEAASSRDAELLGVAVGSPVLACERVTYDQRGRPVLLAEHRFPAARTVFVVELANEGASMEPSGLRLVQ